MKRREYDFQHWNGRLPTISCLCPTYGRPHLIGEAVESFLRQDYPGKKELIILNDHLGTPLSISPHSAIRIVNAGRRFHSLGEKRNTLVALADGELLFPWDDDDISLPSRLSVTVESMRNHQFFKPTNYWWWTGVKSELRRGNGPHSMSAYSRQLFSRAGGYPATQSGHGREFESAVKALGLYDMAELKPEDVGYLYRTTGVNSYHLSHHGHSDGWEACRSHVVSKVDSRKVEITPAWNLDYLEKAATPPIADRPRFLIAVCSAERFAAKRQACRESWLASLPDNCRYFFFVGTGCNPANEPDVVEVDSLDGYHDLPSKTKAMLSSIAGETDFDFLVKCDDDSYLVADRLHEIVNSDTQLTGYVWNNEWKSLSGGAGYMIARKHLREIAGEFDTKGHFEDVETTLAARRLGLNIQATPRLQCGHGQLPSIHNDKISSHWCNPDLLHKIHQEFASPTPSTSRHVMGNFYLLHDTQKWAAVCISKNACTSLKRIVLSDSGIEAGSKNEVHDKIGYSEDSKYLHPLEKGKPDGYTTFAILRDPVARLASVFRHFALDRTGQRGLSHLPLDDFDAWINHAERELALPAGEQDEHFRPQSLYFQAADIDILVRMEDLDQWFLNMGWTEIPRENRSHATFTVTPSQQERIRELYQKDVELVERPDSLQQLWTPSSH